MRSWGGNALVCKVCQFLWHEYFRHGQGQATIQEALHAQLGRDARNTLYSVSTTHMLDKNHGIIKRAQVIAKSNANLESDMF